MIRIASKPLLLSLLPLLWLLVAALPAVAEDDAELSARKRALALEVMEVTGVTAPGDRFADGELSLIRPYYPTVPEETWKELRPAFDPEQVIELSIPIYTRNFDEKELQELVEFYRSPLGRKMVERMPRVMQESMMLMNDWRQRKLIEVVETLREKGYEPVEPEAPAPAPPAGAPSGTPAD